MNPNEGARADARKRRADYLRDMSDQTAEHNTAQANEHQPDQAWLDTQDDRTPTRAELERDNYDDWAWARERDNR